VQVPTAQKIRFGAFELDRQTAELYKNGTKLKLQGQPIAVLALLLERPGELVTREEIRKHLWPEDTFVDFEHSLNTHIKKLRQVFDDDAETPRYIETLPRRGYRFVAQVKAAPNASAVVEQTPSEASTESKAAPPPKSRRWKYSLAVLVAFALLAGLLYRFAAPNVAQLIRLRQLQQLTVVPLTALPGNVASPTFSPDGSQIAFAWDGENNGAGYDLYVKAIGTEKPLRLTHHPAPGLSAAWSPDGRSIAISRASGKDDTGIYLLPPTGGPERKLISRSNVDDSGNEISWSPDGRYLAYRDQPDNPKSSLSIWLFLLRLDTLDRTPVKTGCDTVFTPSYSPRGDYLAWVCRDTQAIFSVNAQRLSDGRTFRVAQIEEDIQGMAWSEDGGRILFSSGSGNLWEASLARPGNVQKLPFGYDALNITVSPAAHQLAYVQGVTNTNIWRLELQASPPKASKLIVSSRQQIAPSISPDGSKIAFQSDRTGPTEVWVCDADGSNPIQLSSFGIKVTGTPRWSPDGKWIAFDSRVGGEGNIYLVDPYGGPPRKLEIDTHGNSMPSWSHDGRSIYFNNGEDAASQSVWKVPFAGGHAVQLARAHATIPIESPDGQYVYFVRNKRLWRVNTDGSGEQAVKGSPELDFLGDKWFPFGSGLYFLSRSGAKTVIEFFDLKTEKVLRVYELEKPTGEWIGGMPVSSDGKWMLFPQMDEQSSNLMMIENWH
jgi:Tol biopolymer transport system component/DNA-binding winged helix-turn-helix (wHTH) protein